MHILIAPNAFKNSLTAGEAARAIEDGFLASLLNCTTECFPIADGGDGTGNLIVKKRQGNFKEVEVHDPLGRKVKAQLGFIDQDKTAVIEMANASGLHLLKEQERDPMKTSSYGTGELALAALDAGVGKIILTVGGSATVDGGTGFLRAFGVKFLDKREKDLTAIRDFKNLNHIDLSAFDERIKKCELTILCDVDNPLLGEEGAAAVFAPQKGASQPEVENLEEALSRFREVVLKTLNNDMAEVKHGGAAGGIAAGLWAFLDARLVNGIEEFIRITGFEESLKKAQLVITGEGSLDKQTLNGKGPYGVAVKAREHHIPVIGLAGHIPLEPGRLNDYFQALFSIGNEPVLVEEALRFTADNLAGTARQVGNLLALTK